MSEEAVEGAMRVCDSNIRSRYVGNGIHKMTNYDVT